MNTIVTCQYRIIAVTANNEHLVSTYTVNEKDIAWKTARQYANGSYYEHVSYSLLNPSGPTLSVQWYKGKLYEHTLANVEADTCQIPGCMGSIYTPHYGSQFCKSGKRPHCTCNSCY